MAADQPTHQPHQVGGAVLTGGRSSRMGRDKALLDWGSGQLLDLALGRLRQVNGIGQVYVVGDREEYHGRGAYVVPDEYPGTGPLGGIATALNVATEDRLLIVAVDMPFLSVPLLEALVGLASAADAVVPLCGGFQPLHAVYKRSCLPAARAQLELGRYRISDLFEHIEVVFPDEDWIRRFDPHGRSFENANTPDEYNRLRLMRHDELGCD